MFFDVPSVPFGLEIILVWLVYAVIVAVVIAAIILVIRLVRRKSGGKK